MADPAHWNDLYQTTGLRSVSWYQERPTAALELLASLGVGADHSLIDIGGGTSNLVDHLVAAGHRDLTVLDISVAALDTSRARLGDPPSVNWIEADLLTWEPVRRWDVWHDRAVLHFLTNDDDRSRYRALLHRSIGPGGAFIIGTFAEDGPTKCSGLPVRRHSVQELLDLAGDVEVVEQRRVVHLTPEGVEQPFNWIAGRILNPAPTPSSWSCTKRAPAAGRRVLSSPQPPRRQG